MKMRLLAATAVAAMAFAATSANAAIIVSDAVANQLFATNEGVILDDFDAIDSAQTTFVGNVVGPFVEDGDGDFDVSNSAPPPWAGIGSITVCCQGGGTYEGDPTKYGSVQGSGTSTYSVTGGYYLTTFNFYMGSPDSYNKVTFNFLGGGSQVFNGDQIWGGNGVVGNGDRTKGFRVYYDFNGAKVTSISFQSGSNAFEFDGLAGTLAIPEPGTWALMIMGFGGAGAMIRRRRAAVAA
jgi:hypothetical protein